LKYLTLALLTLFSFLPSRNYVIQPVLAQSVKNVPTVTTAPRPKVYTQAQIDEMTANTLHPYILRTLIKCESQNTNVARMDSNGLMSYGILQFNGSSTWATWARRSGVSSTPMNPTAAIKVADFMIANGQLHRWTCAYITGLLR
jgi:hypothetical protein